MLLGIVVAPQRAFFVHITELHKGAVNHLHKIFNLTPMFWINKNHVQRRTSSWR